MSKKQYYPDVIILVSCANCGHCHSEGYSVQGDSGHDVYCEHPNFEERRRIGDTTWKTAEWCPELDEGYKKSGLKEMFDY